MLDILTYKDGELTISPEVFVHEPLKYLVERDHTEVKNRARNDLMYIYLMCDPRSSFFGYSEEEREKKVHAKVYGQGKHVDRNIRKAMDYYVKLMLEASQSYNFYLAAKKSADNLTTVMRSMDWSKAEDERAFSLKEYQLFLKDSSTMLQSLNELEKKAREELFSKAKAKANRTINPLEE